MPLEYVFLFTSIQVERCISKSIGAGRGYLSRTSARTMEVVMQRQLGTKAPDTSSKVDLATLRVQTAWNRFRKAAAEQVVALSELAVALRDLKREYGVRKYRQICKANLIPTYVRVRAMKILL
jgi:hypothetical protein